MRQSGSKSQLRVKSGHDPDWYFIRSCQYRYAILREIASRLTKAVVCLIVVCGHAYCQAPPAAQGQLEETSIHSVSLESNLLGDSAEKRVLVYLPPSYNASSTHRYPAIYFLHGFSLNSEEQDAAAKVLRDSMNRLIADNTIQEMIVVIPDGRNSLGGGFYVNSPTSGQYEGYILKDVIPYVDAKYRTIASPAGRGIGGHSMGGFGAIFLAFRHTDAFGAVFAMSPCCLDFGNDSPIATTAWGEVLSVATREDAKRIMTERRFFGSVFIAMAAAFSPNMLRAPLFLDFPFRKTDGKIVPAEPAYDEWRSFAGPEQVRKQKEEILTLKAIAIEYGTRESDIYIPRGARALSQALAELGIPHSLEIFDGDHTSAENRRIETVLLPFFSSHLKSSPASDTFLPTTR